MSMPDFAQALVLTGGGTGGHFFPAVALAEGAQARWPERQVVFVGARRGIEARRLPGGPWPHLLLDVEGFLGRSPLRAAGAAWKLWRAVARLKRAWRAARPWAVIGTGGYGAAPALLAARSLGIPFFLHESNAAPGALVKLVAPKARRVWCGMEAVRDHLREADCLAVGTPVRAAFLRSFRPLEENRPPFRLLILGGSGGARALNEALMGIAAPLLEAFPDWEILHQTGAGEFERLKDWPRHARHALVPFLEHMDEAMEAASLLVSRAGASTCAELRAAGRGGILVPLPTSAGGHQLMNARALAAEGRAVVEIQDGNLASRLASRCGNLMADPAARIRLGGQPEHNRAVLACLEDLADRLEGLQPFGSPGSASQATMTDTK
jgi:UDP-N-acetylglucosamine--N-acetylmuramyl-(pentapeptide) pyrophosphoryl-undecaprenol N-acetylglucosamine transferase